MSLGRREMFSFDTSPYLTMAGMVETDGTANQQVVQGYSPVKVINGGGSVWSAVCEPEQYAIDGNHHHKLDSFSRLIVVSGRSAGTGLWSGDLTFRREGSANNEVLIPFTNYPIEDPAQPVPVFTLNSPLPVDFMTSIDGGEALTDDLTCRIRVDPFDAVTAICFAQFFLVPGFTASVSNKGANVSSRQHLASY